MYSYKISTLSTFLVLCSVYQINAESSTYTAVVIGSKIGKLSTLPSYTLNKTIELYKDIFGGLKHNKTVKPDIIILPEGGLQGENEPFPIEVPSTEDSVIPCNLGDRFSAALKSLSCLAKAEQVYLVVNLVESYVNYSSIRMMRFNTNVAFDRDGKVVARL